MNMDPPESNSRRSLALEFSRSAGTRGGSALLTSQSARSFFRWLPHSLPQIRPSWCSALPYTPRPWAVPHVSVTCRAAQLPSRKAVVGPQRIPFLLDYTLHVKRSETVAYGYIPYRYSLGNLATARASAGAQIDHKSGGI